MATNNPDVVNNVIGPNLGGKDLMETASKQGGLVPQLINLMGDSAPWLVGLLSVCARCNAVYRSGIYVYSRCNDY